MKRVTKETITKLQQVQMLGCTAGLDVSVSVTVFATHWSMQVTFWSLRKDAGAVVSSFAIHSDDDNAEQRIDTILETGILSAK